MIVIARIWCSKCDCYRLRPHGWEDDRTPVLTRIPTVNEPSLRPHMCDVCRAGDCYVDLRLCHPERSEVTPDWLEKRVRPFFVSLTHAERMSMSLEQWLEYDRDPMAYIAKRDRCDWNLA